MRKSKALLTKALAASLVVSNIAVLPVYAEPNDKTAGSSVTLTIASDSNATPPDEGGGGGDDGGGGGGDTPVEPETFSVTVPAIIPISMDLDGNIQVPDDLEVINGNDSAIKCTAIDITLDSQWQATDFDELSLAKMKSKEAENTKQFSIALRGDKLKSDGSLKVTESSWNFAANDSLPLNVRVRIPKQTEVFETDLATVEYTFDWSDVKDSSKADIGADISVQKPKIYTVTFEVPEGATIKNGTSTVRVESGQTVTPPEVELASLRYEPGDWKLADGTVFNNSTPVTADTTVTLETKVKAENPKNWFVASGNTLTGLSDEYLNMIDAPTDLVIPNNIGGSSITSIGSGAFKDKNLLTSVVVPDTVTTIAANAFTGCSNSLKIDVSYAYMYSIPNSPWGINENNIVWDVTEDWDTNPIKSNEVASRGLLFTNNVVSLSSSAKGKIVIPTSIDGIKVTEIGARQYYDTINSSVSEIEIPNTIVKIGDYAFKNCTGLNTLILPNSVEHIGISAFESTKIEELAISNNLKEIGDYAFKYAQINKGLIIPESVYKIGTSAFLRNTVKTGYELSIKIPSGVTSIGSGAFTGYDNLIFDGELEGNFGATLRCESESDIKIVDTHPITIEQLESLGLTSAHNGSGHSIGQLNNTSLSGEVNIPTSVRTSAGYYRVTGISNFKNNTGITKINLPITVTKINKDAFSGCTNLKLSVPNSVYSIGTNAFYNVPEVKYSGSATGSPWGALSIVPNN